MNDLLRLYRQARAIFSEADFAEFFQRAGIANPVHRMICKDILVGAATGYLAEWHRQETRLSQGRIASEIAKARDAAQALSASLDTLFEAGGFDSELSELAQAEKAAIIQKYGADSDTLKIASSIFALDDTHDSFRITGLLGTLGLIDDLLATLQREERARTRKNRLEPLRSMVAPLMTWWFMAFGRLPTVGHYDKEVAERGSGAVSAFAFAAQLVDRNVTERLVVDAMLSIGADMQSQDEAANAESGALASLALFYVISSGETHCRKEYLKMYLELPTGRGSVDEDAFNRAWGSLQTEDTEGDFALITKGKFYETFYSAILKNNSYEAQVEPATE